MKNYIFNNILNIFFEKNYFLKKFINIILVEAKGY